MTGEHEIPSMQEEKIAVAAQAMHEFMMANDGAGVSLSGMAEALDAADVLIHPTEAALLQGVRDGSMIMSGDDGQLRIRLTPKGEKEAAELIHRIATETEASDD